MSEPEIRSAGSDTVFVIPVGPKCRYDFVADTIESIRHFAPGARIIAVDDSLGETAADLASHYPITVVPTHVHGSFGNLYLNLSAGFIEALNEPFEILIRLDTDALVAGSDFEAKAIERFRRARRIGSLGSFRVGYDRIGIRDRTWAKRRLQRFLVANSLIHPRKVAFVLTLILRAMPKGYKMGDGIMGGAAVYSHEALVALRDAKLLGRGELADTGLQEDYSFGLALYAIGYRLDEFGDRDDDLPMGVNWKGLPASPEELLRRGKSLIHSTKFFEDLDEAEIRQRFRSARV